MSKIQTNTGWPNKSNSLTRKKATRKFITKRIDFPISAGRGDSVYIQIPHLAQGPFSNKLCQVEECNNALHGKLFLAEHPSAMQPNFFSISLGKLKFDITWELCIAQM